MTRRVPRPLRFAGLLAALGLVLGCGAGHVEPPTIQAATFVAEGLAVRAAGALDWLEVLDDRGQVIERRVVGDPAPGEARLVFAWRDGARYQVRAGGAGGESVLDAIAPARALAEVRLRVPLLDPGDAEELTVPVQAGSRVDALLELRALGSERVTFTAEVRSEGGVETFAGELRAAGEAWYRPLQLMAPETAAGLVSVVVVLEQGGRQARIERTRTLVPRVSSTLASVIHIGGALMPTDVTGARDPRLRPDTIPLPGRVTSSLRRWLGVPLATNDPYDPFVWQSIRIECDAGAPAMALEVHGSIVDAAGAPVPALAPPDLHRAGVTSTRVWTLLAPGASRTVTLPIYVDLAHVEPGYYERVVRLHVPGEHDSFLERRFPLEVLEPRETPLLVTLVVIVATTLGLAIAFALRQRIFRHFRSRDLVLASLAGATDFALVALPEIAFFNIVHALLGPLSVVLTGALTGALHFGLLTCLLMLAPRRGMIALVLVVRLLLSGIVMGQLSLVAILYTTTTVSLLEGALCVTAPSQLRGRLWILPVLLLAIAQALAVLVNFQLSKTLYRFFFADWFVVLSVLVDGGLYTIAGCWFGRRVGLGLLRVSG